LPLRGGPSTQRYGSGGAGGADGASDGDASVGGGVGEVLVDVVVSVEYVVFIVAINGLLEL
jgi:hypothetical protein